MTKVGIRRLQDSDAPAVSALLAQLGYPVEAGQLKVRIARMATELSHAFVAIDRRGRILGLASMHLLQLLTDDAPVGYVTSLVVAEDARRAGAGRALVEHLAERAREYGCERLCVTTHLRRAPAHAFYERLGFDFTGRRYVLTLDASRRKTITPR